MAPQASSWPLRHRAGFCNSPFMTSAFSSMSSFLFSLFSPAQSSTTLLHSPYSPVDILCTVVCTESQAPWSANSVPFGHGEILSFCFSLVVEMPASHVEMHEFKSRLQLAVSAAPRSGGDVQVMGTATQVRTMC